MSITVNSPSYTGGYTVKAGTLTSGNLTTGFGAATSVIYA